MRTAGRHGGIAILALGAWFLAAPRAARAEEPALTDEDRADLAWFDGLGYPKADPATFGTLHLGWNDVNGFLAADDGKSLVVLGVDLRTWRVPREPVGVKSERPVGFERKDLADACGAWLAGGPCPARVEPVPFARSPGVEAGMLYLTWCLGPARDGLRHELLAHARTLRPSREWPVWKAVDAALPLRERAAAQMAQFDLTLAKMALIGYGEWGVDLVADRKAQAALFRRVAERFPGTESGAEATRHADILDRMVREADARAAHPPKAPETDEARAAALVYALRDVGSEGPAAMGGPGEIEKGAFQDLVAMGMAAAPTLIEALADDSFTRYGGEGRGGWSPYVYSVGDMALMALGAISGRSFATDPGWTWESGVPRAAACRKSAEAWLAEARSGGEVESLVREVEKGDVSVALPALVERAPSRVFDAAMTGLAASTHDWWRAEFAKAIARTGDPRAKDVLHDLLAKGNRAMKAEIASILVARGDPAGIDTFVALWQERRDPGARRENDLRGSLPSRADELRAFAQTLLDAKRADLVAVVGEGLAARSATTRRVASEVLLEARKGASGEFGDALDAALASLLSDRTEAMAWLADGKPAAGLAWRVCDGAAAALAPRVRAKPPSASDPLWLRDAAVDDVANAWARAHGGAERARTPPPSLPSLDATKLAALEAAMARLTKGYPSHPDNGPRAAALAELEAFGPAAVPVLRAAVDAQRFQYDRDVREVLGRLSFTVAAVRFVPDEAHLPAALRDAALAAREKPLDVKRVLDLFDSLIASAPSRGGASLDVYRDAATGGVVLTIQAQDPVPDGVGRAAIAGDLGLGEGNQGGWTSADPHQREDLRALAARVLATPPDRRAWLHVRFVRDPSED